MPKTALITGASSGIGRDLARIHASKKGNLVIVARRLQELEALKTELETAYGVKVFIIQADLSKPGAAQEVYDKTIAHNITVDYLINNAGFGGFGKFSEQDWNTHQSMVDVNISALMALTYLFLQNMISRNSGKILNVGSTAGFLPGPLQAVYYATKAFVLSFSQALAEELSDTGITVTVLCPGPVATGFVEAANLEGSNLVKNAAASYDVALLGYNAMLKGSLVKIDDFKLNFLLNWVLPFLPRKLVLKMSRERMEKN
jgi:short-subunit dehydrogenase